MGIIIYKETANFILNGDKLVGKTEEASKLLYNQGLSPCLEAFYTNFLLVQINFYIERGIIFTWEHLSPCISSLNLSELEIELLRLCCLV